nr:bidirectional sugar transporter SWEET14-like [Ziziphus jujuba var. spinosa]
MAHHHALTLAIGRLGNIISFMVYLAPIPTFHKVYKKKSTEGFQSLPFVVELFSSMLSMYDEILKGHPTFISINAVGSVIETFYITFFLFFAPKKSRVMQMVLLILLIAVGYGLMVILTLFLAKGQKHIQIMGWILLVFNLIVSASPLCEMRKVIQTKSVEFMPILLSLFHTLGAVTGFFYWLLLKDYKSTMWLYIAYNSSKEISQEPMVNPGLNQVVLQPNDNVGNVINITVYDNL